MKLLLGGSLMALILLSELVGLVVLARHTLSAEEAHYPAQEEGSFTIVVVAAQEEEGEGDYRWVEWEGPSSSSCSVWEVRREAQRRGVNSPESRGSINGGEEEGCRGVHVRPHLATTRQPGVRPTGGHRPEPTTSENSPSGHLGE
jgi:hypothetical protein